MSDFKREERYIVVKLKHLAGLQQAPLRNFLRENRVPQIECVVVEHDWPEYHLVWAMIEHRMAGKPVPDFNLWRRADALQALLTETQEDLQETQALSESRGRQSSAFEERMGNLQILNGKLQQRLTAADERADVLEGLLREVQKSARKQDWASGYPTLFASVDAELKPAKAERNQCDGCQAGIPVVSGAHRMGKPGGYPDTMSCTAKLYRPAEGGGNEAV